MPDLNPKQTLLNILHGVKRFKTEKFPERKELFSKLANGQEPKTLFITCADSRIHPELLTDQDPGNLFVLRNIGNIIPAYGNAMGGVTSAIEYAVCALKVSTIIVCGHSNCGAMDALIHPEKTDSMPAVKSWLKFAATAHAVTDALTATDVGPENIQTLTEHNVLLQLQHLRTHPSIAAALARNEVALQGWYYDIPNGQVYILNEETRHDMTVSQAIELLQNQVDERRLQE
ncbi:Carbonic anhydrase (CynT) (PDB:1EKJ) (PUBMED:22081392) [Commensalibacter communis]|uniref:carbonic anhydrase n=1 Tax=Commensalibacter communis TaxID=2972786 RepID=UPI0022FF8AFB|nr:carbonic anhydrase [Commensalibacter communis]CAI3927596.1 Carbonic anhydrase (CynT) (PDB:1EKJ) (PUBMED:22081392) [Commensalibacter communis]CAI3931727.1 Carbonic anhydrase (CynT) (PDB:1EKJ) (PUBMED:22081392) [Commensalibacter communis]